MRKATQKTKAAAGPEVMEIDDGIVRFRVRSGESIQEREIDLYLGKLACERCEKKHNLAEVDGLLVPTAEFLSELATEFTKAAGHTVTPSVAAHLWPEIVTRFYALKKNTNETPS